MEISNINGKDYSNIIAQTSTTGLESKLGSITSDEDVTNDALMAACKEFETYLIEQVYKGMESTIDKAEDEDQYTSYFGDMLVQEYSSMASDQGSIGLAERLYESMKNNYGNAVSSTEESD